MRLSPIALAAALIAATAFAPAKAAEDKGAGQTQDPPLSERLDRALRGMMEGVQPTLEGALDYLRSFGAIDDPRHYELPEVLPNGDIIIRRRADAPEFQPGPGAPGEALPNEPGPPPDGRPPADPEDGVRI